MIDIKLDIQDRITGDITKLKRELGAVPKAAVTEYQKLTPIKSGNARRKTTLKGNSIQANYPYAQRLDEGYSKQAPKGMTKPWEQWLQKYLDKLMKR
jgi:hypothetical protein